VVVGEGEVTFRISCPPSPPAELSMKSPAGVERNGRLLLTADRLLADLDSFPSCPESCVRYVAAISVATGSRSHPCTALADVPPLRFLCHVEVNRESTASAAPRESWKNSRRFRGFIDLVDDNTFENVHWALDLAGLIRQAGIRKVYKLRPCDTIAAHPELVAPGRRSAWPSPSWF